MQLMWVAGPTASVRTISITAKKVLVAVCASAFVLVTGAHLNRDAKTDEVQQHSQCHEHKRRGAHRHQHLLGCDGNSPHRGGGSRYPH